MRVLIVEDEHKIANSLKKGLELERFAVDVAYDGTNGFDLASTEPYDVIILDLMLPGIGGLDICDMLRKKGIHTPILILTAKGQVHDKVEGLNYGADDYLTKPFAFEELLARVRALTRRPKDALMTQLKVDNLVLDTMTFDVTRQGIPIKLTGKEFAFLEYLMRNANKIVTKENIINHVWDYDADILPNTVEVYIKNLRCKIDVPFTRHAPLIHTVRGFGYKFGAPYV